MTFILLDEWRLILIPSNLHINNLFIALILILTIIWLYILMRTASRCSKHGNLLLFGLCGYSRIHQIACSLWQLSLMICIYIELLLYIDCSILYKWNLARLFFKGLTSHHDMLELAHIRAEEGRPCVFLGCMDITLCYHVLRLFTLIHGSLLYCEATSVIT